MDWIGALITIILVKALEQHIKALIDFMKFVLETLKEYLLDFLPRFIGAIWENRYIILAFIVVAIIIVVAQFMIAPYSAAIMNWILSSPTLTKLYIAFLYVKNWLLATYRVWSLRIAQWIAPYWMKLKPIVNFITKYIGLGITYLKSFIQWIRTSILGKLIGIIGKSAEVIFTFVVISDIVKDLRDGKVAKAVWTAIKALDEKFTRLIEQTAESIEKMVAQVQREITDMIDMVQYDVKVVDSKASYLERAFGKMYEAFGVQLFGDLEREIDRFRNGVLRTVSDDLKKADSWIQHKFRLLRDPIYEFLKLNYTVEKLFREERWLAEAFAYNPYREGLIRYQQRYIGGIAVPPEIAKVILGR